MAEYAAYFASLTDEELVKKLRPGILEAAALVLARQEAASRKLAVSLAPLASSEWDEIEPMGDFVTVARFLEPTEAYILQAYLENCGLPVIVCDVNLAQTYLLISQALGGARVRVPARFAPQAFDLLAHFQQGKAELNAADLVAEVFSEQPSEDARGHRKRFEVYVHTDSETPVIVKQGFSWGAFFFGPLWFWVHSMWPQLLVVGLYYAGVLLYAHKIAPSNPIMNLGICTVDILARVAIGKMANPLLGDALRRRGYRLIATVRAKNSSYAWDEVPKNA